MPGQAKQNRRGKVEIQPAKIRLRLIQPTATDVPGAVLVSGALLAPSWGGINGRSGFTSGQYERRTSQEGSFQVTLPNASGSDGDHRDRFLSLIAPNYRPGDEFVEVWRGSSKGPGDLLYVGVPVSPVENEQTITLNGFDPWWLLNGQRETTAGFWCNAPRDVWEAYTQLWQPIVVDGFDQTPRFNGLPAGATGSAGLTNPQVTADGKWAYSFAADSPVPSNVRLTGTPQIAGVLQTNTIFPAGLSSRDSAGRWRIECAVIFPATMAANDAVAFSASGDNGNYMTMTITPSGQAFAGGLTPHLIAGAIQTPLVGTKITAGQHSMAIEGRGRWVYFYYDGQLLGVLPMALSATAQPTVSYLPSGTSPGQYIDIDHFVIRQAQPFLMRSQTDHGDYQLPGSPTPGGLGGAYFNDVDLGTDQYRLQKVLNPLRSVSTSGVGLYARRVDPTINFPVQNPPTWQPAGGGPNTFSARWTGSIYLDLANYDYRVQTIGSVAVRAWIGKTRFPIEQVIDNWSYNGGTNTSGYFRQWLGRASGWYPIIVECYQEAQQAGLTFSWERSDQPNVFTVVPSNMLSPQGIFEQQIRNDSYYQQLKNLQDSYGYQATLEPMSLESGEFPGRLCPRVRVGKDTDVILDHDNTIAPQVTIAADQVADSIIVDAQGLADPSGSGQLYAEAFNLGEYGKHLVPWTQYDSPGDIQVPAQLHQRAQALLALRQGPLISVDGRPEARREIVQTFDANDPSQPAVFPVGGKLAEWKCLPGDGVRRRFPRIGVNDLTPTQIVSVQWAFYPDGISPPAVGFRQKVRSAKETLTRLARESIDESRNYQSQFAIVPGSHASNNGAGAAIPSLSTDTYSRVSLPANMANVVRATFVVESIIAAGTAQTIYINNISTGLAFTAAGRYDVTGFVGRDGTNARAAASTVGGTTQCDYKLELLLRV